MAESTAKAILRNYRKEGRIGPKLTRNRRKNLSKQVNKNEKPFRTMFVINGYKSKRVFPTKGYFNQKQRCLTQTYSKKKVIIVEKG